MALPTHDPLPELRARVLRDASMSGRMQPIPRVAFWASESLMKPRPAIWEPVLYLVLQGKKRLTNGERKLEYGMGGFLLGAIHVPVLCEVTEATREVPYLGIALGLDRRVVSALLVEMKDAGDSAPAAKDDDEDIHALTIGQATVPMYDALLRLVRLLDTPADIPLLAPMIEREVLYRVLQTRHGGLLRQLAQSDSRISQIQRAVAWIREHQSEPLRVESLAEIASMSLSSFHRHFKSVTGLSPLAYQKQMRLQEARRRLIAEPTSGGGVASVAFAVGYESASQFSREYARKFGMSPAKDAARVREG